MIFIFWNLLEFSSSKISIHFLILNENVNVYSWLIWLEFIAKIYQEKCWFLIANFKIRFHEFKIKGLFSLSVVVRIIDVREKFFYKFKMFFFFLSGYKLMNFDNPEQIIWFKYKKSSAFVVIKTQNWFLQQVVKRKNLTDFWKINYFRCFLFQK